MTVGSADLCKAVNTAWDASDLDTIFKGSWPTEKRGFFVLIDQQARAGQPWPYVVMDQPDQTVVSRSSSTDTDAKREIRDIEVRFNVHAARDPNLGKDPKEHAGDLAEEIMKVFGGHPSRKPTATITLDHGNHLITRYNDDFGIWTAEDEYQWVVIYTFRIDVPVRIPAQTTEQL